MADDFIRRWSKYRVEPGMRRWYKALVHGPPKSGKSNLLASFPSPKAAISVVEGGIEYLLKKSAGDVCFYFPIDAAPADLVACVVDLCRAAKTGAFKSIVLDSGTMVWEVLKKLTDAAADDAGRDVGYEHWRFSKGPNLRLLTHLMSAPCHVGASAWVRTTMPDGGDAEEGSARKKRLRIKKISRAKTELSWGHVFDLWFETEALEDSEGQPSGEYSVNFVAGRVPEAIPMDLLYFNKVWQFDARKERLPPSVVWDRVFAPLEEYYHSERDETKFLGNLDEFADRDARESITKAADAHGIGEMARLALSASSLEEYRRIYEKSLGGIEETLSPEARGNWRTLHEQIKERLARTSQ